MRDSRGKKLQESYIPSSSSPSTSTSKDKLKHLDSVLLLPEEYRKLVDLYGKKVVDSKIEDLDNYIGSKGKQYKSHYKTLLGWLKKDNAIAKDRCHWCGDTGTKYAYEKNGITKRFRCDKDDCVKKQKQWCIRK